MDSRSICSTRVTAGTAGVPLLVPVPGGEGRACQVPHRVWAVPGQEPEVNGVILLGTAEVDVVFAEMAALFPVFQLDTEDGVPPQ